MYRASYLTCPTRQVRLKVIAGAHFVAATVALPSATPIASPVAEMVTIEESELLQLTDEVTSFPRLSMAWYCTWFPTETV